MHPYIVPIANTLYSMANAHKAAGAKAYMRHQFAFLGIATIPRRNACKAYMKDNRLTDATQLYQVTRELWQLPEREFQYFGIELLIFHRQLWNNKIVQVMEDCITQKSWWDTVDFLSAHVCGPFFKDNPQLEEKVTQQWNKSENMWLQRASLLYQLGYRQQTNLQLLAQYIERLSPSKEFFIQKAIGWMLRSYARVNPQWVKTFVAEHTLAALSRREALKHLQ